MKYTAAKARSIFIDSLEIPWVTNIGGVRFFSESFLIKIEVATLYPRSFQLLLEFIR